MFRMIKAVTVMAGVLLVSTGASQAQVIYGQENSNLTRANQSMMAGDLESASKYFRRAVKANLGHERLVPTLNNYCAVEYAIGNFENAEKVCSEAISNDRRYWRAYVNRANVRAALGDAEAQPQTMTRHCLSSQIAALLPMHLLNSRQKTRPCSLQHLAKLE